VFGDPVNPDSLHPFGYAGGNPVGRVDPDGRFFKEFFEALSRSMNPAIPRAYRQMDAAAVKATLDAPKNLYEADKAIVQGAQAAFGKAAGDACYNPEFRNWEGAANCATAAQLAGGMALLPLSIWTLPEALYDGPGEFVGGAKQALSGAKNGNSYEVGKGTARMAGVVGMYAGVGAAGMGAFGVKGPVLLPAKAPLEQLSFSFMEGMPEQVAPTPLLVTRGQAAEFAASAPTVYSTAYEFELPRTQLGRARGVHERLLLQSLDEDMTSTPSFGELMEDLIQGVKDAASSKGGRELPSGWTCEHCSRSTAAGREGVLRLVPTDQHAPGSHYWRLFHPDQGAAGGYSEWAVPNGAPPNRTSPRVKSK